MEDNNTGNFERSDEGITEIKAPPPTDLRRLYPGMTADDIAARLRLAFDGFRRVFGTDNYAPPRLFSASGRAELIGNHTDHQGGLVIAAAVALDDVAAAVPTGDTVIRVFSESYGLTAVDLSDLSPLGTDTGTPAALIRGIAEYLSKQGYTAVGGFDAYISGLVPVGSGLSSSAAFEVLIAITLNGLYFGGKIPSAILARAGQYAENVHYGKPCGLMDQMTVASGGVIRIDFEKPGAPEAEQLSISLADYGYILCIIDTGAKHDQLSGEYAAIPAEMTGIAKHLNTATLRGIKPEQFYDALPELRTQVSDRALLRAAHFFEENERVKCALDTLKNGDFDGYLSLVRESGRSSWQLLQNIYPGSSVHDQSAALALMWCARLLGGAGACRIHGGGFGGTIEAYVPVEASARFKDQMERLTGPGSCRFLRIRDAGAVEIII